jgi:hypothetical protein
VKRLLPLLLLAACAPAPAPEPRPAAPANTCLRVLDPPEGYFWLRVEPSGRDQVFKAVATSVDPLRRPREMHVLLDLSTGRADFLPGEGTAAAPDPGSSGQELDDRLSAATREKYRGLFINGVTTRSELIESVAREDTGLRSRHLNVVAGNSRVVAWEDDSRFKIALPGNAPAPAHVAAWQGFYDHEWRRVPPAPLAEWWEAKASEEFVTLWNCESGKGAVYSFPAGSWSEVSAPEDTTFSALVKAAGRCLVGAGYETVAAYNDREAAWSVLTVPGTALLPHKIELVEGSRLAVATVHRSVDGSEPEAPADAPQSWRLEIILVDLAGR